MLEFIIGKYNYWIYIALMMIGFWAMIAKKNLVKKVIGMNIFQTAIILYFISIASKWGASIPIDEHAHGHHAVEVPHYLNPLPHVLMLTAIVVMVSTLGVVLAIIIQIYRRYHTLDEEEILAQLSSGGEGPPPPHD